MAARPVAGPAAGAAGAVPAVPVAVAVVVVVARVGEAESEVAHAVERTCGRGRHSTAGCALTANTPHAAAPTPARPRDPRGPAPAPAGGVDPRGPYPHRHGGGVGPRTPTRKMCRVNVWNRRTATVVAGALPVVVLVSLVGLPTVPGTDIDLTVPYAAEGEGPTFNTLGDVDGTPVVDVTGAQTDETSGNLNMTTVSVRTRLSLSQALGRWITSDDTIVPLEQVIPSNTSPEDVQRQNAAAFAASESNATVAAMNHLGRPLETMVAGVNDDSPASGAVKENDIITAVDGQQVRVPGDVADKIADRSPGDRVTLSVRRQGHDEKVEVTLGEVPESLRSDSGASAFLGVTMVAQPAGDLRVEYNLKDIGGPSAGLMFSLAVVDKLSPGELSGGRFIAGTGTIDADGSVGPIGGITHKIAAAAHAGAEAFLVPEGNCAEATSRGYDGDPTLIKVSSLDQAVDELDTFTSGGSPTTCG
nr:PDZ domain-containing protein [Corynebacterium bovis]